MNLFDALGAAGTASDKNVTDFTARMTSLQALHNAQKAAELERQTRLGTTDIGEAAFPAATQAPAPIAGIPAGPAAPAAPADKRTPRKSYLPAPSQATENQSNAESRRLGAIQTPAEKGAAGERPGAKTPALEAAKAKAAQSRVAELQRLNPSIGLPDQSAAETARLNRSGYSQSLSPGVTDQLTPEFFARQRQVESGGNPNAVSPKGAIGEMQTMPATLADPGYGVTPARDNSPAELRRVGEDYMRALLSKFGNMRDALVAYNWGPGNAQKWLSAGGDVSRLPAETQGYLRKLLGAAAGAVMPSAQAQAPVTQTAAPAAQPQTFTAEQFLQFAPQVNQQAQVARMRLAEINRLRRLTGDPAKQFELFNAAQGAQGVIFESQLYDAATRAQAGDQGAMTQLAQVANVQYAQTPQGFVTVAVDPTTGNGRATSQPMNADAFAQMLFQRGSAIARQAQAAAAAERAKQAAQGAREIAVEQVKGEQALRKAIVESQGKLQQEMLKYQLDSNSVANVQTYGAASDKLLITRKDGRVFRLEPATEVNGVQMEAQLIPVQ